MIERLEGEVIAPLDAPPAERVAADRGLERSVEGGPRVASAASPAQKQDAAGDDAPGREEARGEEPLVPLAPEELRGALEAVLFAVSEPISIRALADLFQVSAHEVRAALEDLRLEYLETGRAFRVEDIAGGVQLLTVSKFDPWVRRLRQKEREGKLSAAALETLSVIAYKQPIGKADLESIRGVGCGPILKSLLERGLIQVVGRSDALGRPLLYGTTRRFLESFGLGTIRDLPQPEIAPGARPAPPQVQAQAQATPAEPFSGAPEVPQPVPAPDPGSLTTPGGPIS
ncbi:MAG: SMC-Scp complex subunit ScpB [Planctomycetes bacterium]|nr:SMC-Scp complex subunit ScpB [Planctomycetota bacterium]